MYVFLLFAGTRGGGSSLETTTKNIYFVGRPWAKTSSYTGDQQLCLWHKDCLSVADFILPSQRTLLCSCSALTESVTPQLWGRGRKPRVHHESLQGGIRMRIIQQWVNFLPKIKFAGVPLCLSAMEGLNHSKIVKCFLSISFWITYRVSFCNRFQLNDIA